MDPCRVRMKAALLLALALAMATGCGDQDGALAKRRVHKPSEPEPPAAAPCPGPDSSEALPWLIDFPVPDFPAELPVRRRGDAVLTGKVVSNAGNAIAEARVRLVSYRDWSLERPRGELLGAAVTRASGAFALPYPEIASPDTLYLVIDANGMRRQLAVPVDSLDEHKSIRLSRVRRLPIELHCSELFEEESAFRPTVAAVWHSDGASRPVDASWSSVSLTPAHCEFRAEGETHFRGGMDLPIGTIDLIFAGHCGYATRRVEVPEGDGALATLEITLPSADSGALEFHFTAPSEPPCSGRRCPSPPWITEVWRDPDFSRNVVLWSWSTDPLRTSTTARLRGLPPGRYHIGIRGVPHAERIVQIDPGEAARIDLHWTDRLVHHVPANH